MLASLIPHDESTWPQTLLAVLDAYREVLLGWEERRAGRTPSHPAPAHAFDAAIFAIRDALSGQGIRGYHCTRLTDTELGQIITQGMTLQNGGTLTARLDAVVAAGALTREAADRMKGDNEADDDTRAGMLWFCFFPTHKAGQDGIERFFRSWGGEALYNSHEEDEETGPLLCSVGIPCVIEADVILDAKQNQSLAFKLARIYLVNRGFKTRECIDPEGYASSAIPSQNIRRIVRFPSDEFMALTQAADWEPPLADR